MADGISTRCRESRFDSTLHWQCARNEVPGRYCALLSDLVGISRLARNDSRASFMIERASGVPSFPHLQKCAVNRISCFVVGVKLRSRNDVLVSCSRFVRGCVRQGVRAMSARYPFESACRNLLRLHSPDECKPSSSLGEKFWGIAESETPMPRSCASDHCARSRAQRLTATRMPPSISRTGAGAPHAERRASEPDADLGDHA